ncbi:zinc-dependent alcohol dehydrogenase [Thermoclostridium caenicola]|uniref:L-iditol 2-dehydrogenase n=1 Tax=Thermoclostridium caenicola TaxID=659425 RepID=A0A1M6DWM5_9FIRM|nr:alcohol dehydrogenase catalytic domain-containing protein [Thermoclostridium caenicola]SHI77646.1 L-iditol 2-dehydrogenase [Thermoclostridium caenicola]HOP72264.1 alcohol dehydrogenase catalytic domain-containing protein [Thermoclostridium caenicola]
MKQAIMLEPGRIEYRDVPVPEVGPGQIEVKIRKIGVCGSDIHVWHGKHPYTSYPVVQGHEVSAVVTKLGEGVTEFKVGDLVTIQPQVVCGKCYPCTHGLYNDCEELKVMGFQTTGMASEYFVVDAVKAIKLPDGMSDEHGAMIEPLAVACHAVRRFGDIAGKNVVVIGGGPIGNLVAQTAKAKGAAKVIITEISDYRLKVAEKCGLITVNPTQTTLRDAIRSAFGSDGADVIFECIGSPKTLEEAVEVARKGSDIIVVGVVPDLCPINMGFVQDHELRLIGSAMYRVEDYREAIELVGKGLIEFDALITHRVPFSDYAGAYRLIEEQKDKAMKVMIDMEK